MIAPEELTIKEWEEKNNVMFLSDEEFALDEKITEQELSELITAGQAVGVDHKARTKFLEDHDYPVTRENMLDASLLPRGKQPKGKEIADSPEPTNSDERTSPTHRRIGSRKPHENNVDRAISGPHERIRRAINTVRARRTGNDRKEV